MEGTAKHSTYLIYCFVTIRSTVAEVQGKNMSCKLTLTHAVMKFVHCYSGSTRPD